MGCASQRGRQRMALPEDTGPFIICKNSLFNSLRKASVQTGTGKTIFTDDKRASEEGRERMRGGALDVKMHG